MPSPFPGMDPYLESPAHWPDFHFRFISALADAINARVPDRYVARINEHVMAITPTVWEEDEGSVYVPDVTLLSSPYTEQSGGELDGADASAAAVQTPVVMENVRYAEDHTEAYVQLVRLPDMAVITVFELLSPTNKYGEGRGIYSEKRRQFLAQPIHIIELDLLRAGARLQFDRQLPSAHYHAFVSRTEHRPKTDVYSWSIHDPLPTIPIPLQSPDADVHLPLGESLSAAYDSGRYRRLIDYTAVPPRPPLSQVDEQWVRQMGR